MNQVAEATYFFMHITKAAGTSFARHLDDNFSADEIHPHRSTKGSRHIEQYGKVLEVRPLERSTTRPTSPSTSTPATATKPEFLTVEPPE